MFNTTNYASKIRAGVGNGQSKMAKANNSYKASLLSGEGSLQKGRHKLHVAAMETANYRIDEGFANQQFKDDLQANKDQLKLISSG